MVIFGCADYQCFRGLGEQRSYPQKAAVEARIASPVMEYSQVCKNT
jgi:hypothetical protein